MFKMHNVGTVPMFKMHNIGTVPTFKMHNVGTLKFRDFLYFNFDSRLGPGPAFDLIIKYYLDSYILIIL